MFIIFLISLISSLLDIYFPVNVIVGIILSIYFFINCFANGFVLNAYY